MPEPPGGRASPTRLRTYAKKNLGAYIEEARERNDLTNLEARANDAGPTISFAKGVPGAAGRTRGCSSPAPTRRSARRAVPGARRVAVARRRRACVGQRLLQQAPKDVAWAGVRGRGLDRERKGVLQRLSARCSGRLRPFFQPSKPTGR